MNRGDNFDFPSTGDPEKDAAIAARIRLSMARESEGMCPNGCAPLRWSGDWTAHCSVCNFKGLGYERPSWIPITPEVPADS